VTDVVFRPVAAPAGTIIELAGVRKTYATGAVSVEAHEVAIQRMITAGANMMTWLAVAAEWQRDWARADQAVKLTEVILQHAGGSGIAFLWEQQLLNTPVPKSAG